MLRDELAEIFQPEFFPATAADLCAEVMSPQTKCSEEVIYLVIGLENDPNFKYNSIDEILPQENYTDYPAYTKELCWMHKIISSEKAVVICTSDLLSSYSSKVEVCLLKDLIKDWKKLPRITKQEFDEYFELVNQKIKDEIYEKKDD